MCPFDLLRYHRLMTQGPLDAIRKQKNALRLAIACVAAAACSGRTIDPPIDQGGGGTPSRSSGAAGTGGSPPVAGATTGMTGTGGMAGAGAGGGSTTGAGGSNSGSGSMAGVGTGGASTTGAGGSPSSCGAGGSAGASLDGGLPAIRGTLSQVLAGAPWMIVQTAAGIAVDAHGRVYVQDPANIYQVDGTSISVYLTLDEAKAVAPSEPWFVDIDIDSDDVLYVLLMGTVLQSRAAHQSTLWASLAPSSFATRLGVFEPSKVGLVSRSGFSVLQTTKNELVYPMAQLQNASGCATEDLATAPSGVFLYEPGCNGSPILRGKADGSGVSVLYTAGIFSPPTPLHAGNFICTARDPCGGFYVVVRDLDNLEDPRLYHLTEDATGSNGLTAIETVPSLADAEKSQSEVFAFLYCSLAVGRDGTVFLQTRSQLWKVTF